MLQKYAHDPSCYDSCTSAPLHGVRFCAPRNVSQFIMGSGQRYERQYVTTSKNSYVPHKGLPVGFTNQGVMSEKTQFLHWKQSL